MFSKNMCTLLHIKVILSVEIYTYLHNTHANSLLFSYYLYLPIKIYITHYTVTQKCYTIYIK